MPRPGALAFEYSISRGAQESFDFGDAFEMAWREDERQLAEADAQFTPRVDDDLLLARRGRAGDQYRASGRESLKLRAAAARR